MGFNINDALSAFLILFAVIDIPGSIPIIVSLRKKVGHVQSEKATIVAGIIMIVFLFIGESILNLLGVDVQSFAIAGSFVIFFLALEMILGITLYKVLTCWRTAIISDQNAVSVLASAEAKASYHSVKNTESARSPGRFSHISSAVKLSMGAIHRQSASAK